MRVSYATRLCSAFIDHQGPWSLSFIRLEAKIEREGPYIMCLRPLSCWVLLQRDQTDESNDVLFDDGMKLILKFRKSEDARD
jgi:hypothetical protein